MGPLRVLAGKEIHAIPRCKLIVIERMLEPHLGLVEGKTVSGVVELPRAGLPRRVVCLKGVLVGRLKVAADRRVLEELQGLRCDLFRSETRRSDENRRERR